MKNKIKLLFCPALAFCIFGFAQDRLQLGMKNKIKLLFCPALALHYL